MNTGRCILFLQIVLIALLSACSVRAVEPQEDGWFSASNGSAMVLPAKSWNAAIFQPLRYGLTGRLEISAHPLLFPLLPNLAVKWQHAQNSRYCFSSRHSLYYPTILMRLLAREGTGGIISPEFTIPHMVAFTNEALLTRLITKGHSVTAKVGLALCLFRSAEPDARTTIDLPLVFPRLQVFYHQYNLRAGLESLKRVGGQWYYLVDADGFFTPGAEEKWAMEHKGLLLWNKSQRTQFSFGYKLVYGQYPFGTQWHLLAPLIDVQWSWGGRP